MADRILIRHGWVNVPGGMVRRVNRTTYEAARIGYGYNQNETFRNQIEATEFANKR